MQAGRVHPQPQLFLDRCLLTLGVVRAGFSKLAETHGIKQDLHAVLEGGSEWFETLFEDARSA